MSWPALIVFLLAAVCVVGLAVVERARLRNLLDRPCAGMRWHRRFSLVPHDDIRLFLKLFTEAFAFDEIHSCKFTPDDQPLAIYNARYVPHLTLDDHLEFESYAEILKDKYAINLEAVWRDDITLGELFTLTRGETKRSI